MGKSMVSCRFSLKPIHWLKMCRNDPNRATMNLNVVARRWFKLTMRQRWNGHNPRPRRRPIHQLLGTCHMYHHMYHHVLYLFDSIDIGTHRKQTTTNNSSKFSWPTAKHVVRLSEMSMSFGCRDQNVLEPSSGRFWSDDFDGFLLSLRCEPMDCKHGGDSQLASRTGMNFSFKRCGKPLFWCGEAKNNISTFHKPPIGAGFYDSFQKHKQFGWFNSRANFDIFW